MKRFRLWPSGLTPAGHIMVGLGVAVTAGIAGVIAASAHSTSLQETKTAHTKQAVQADRIETKQITDTESIPYITKTEDDATLAKGQTKVVQTGQNGVRTRTYTVTYTNGAETNRELIADEITTPAVDHIVHNGTYVAPARTSCSGGYVNVDGACIPSPSTNPSGATAQCVDGTYSYSQHRSGTCSHHGGVARWL